MKQKEIFLNGEGDAWFSRNETVLNKLEASCESNHLSKYVLDGFKILEIGCSDGSKLNRLKSSVNSKRNEFFGIDPSSRSIKAGKIKYPNFNLSVGTSDELPFADDFFDLVIVGFCFYLIDRNLIFKSISEIDRVLKQNKYLAITDFDAPIPYKNRYIYKKEIYSYKNSYSRFFEGGGHYSVIEKVSFSHSGEQFEQDFDNRVSTTILIKEDYSRLYKLNG